MAKSFVFDRYDLYTHSDGCGTHIVEYSSAEGEYVKAQDAIDRDEVLKAQIRVLELQLKEVRANNKALLGLMHSPRI